MSVSLHKTLYVVPKGLDRNSDIMLFQYSDTRSLCAPAQKSSWACKRCKITPNAPNFTRNLSIPALARRKRSEIQCQTKSVGPSTFQKYKETSTNSSSYLDSLGDSDQNLSLNARDEDERHQSKNSERLWSAAGCIGTGVALMPIIAIGQGWDDAMLYIASYTLEFSMSGENLLMYLIIFNYFGIPRSLQPLGLRFGIPVILLARGTLIFAGGQLFQNSYWATLGFGSFLLLSSGSTFFYDRAETKKSPGKGEKGGISHVLSIFRSLKVSNDLDGNKFFTRRSGETLATPLFLALVCIEISDVIFALDSVPAVLSISSNLFNSYIANVLAVIGTRSLFFIAADSMAEIRFLPKALGIIMAFMGLKMIFCSAGYEMPVLPTMIFILTVISTSLGFSFAFPENDD